MKNTKSTNSEIRSTIRSILLVLLFIIVSASGFSLQANENISAGNAFQQEQEVILYIVDGEEWSSEEVDRLELDEIEQIEYIREKEKFWLYTDKDVDVVVVIKLKKQEEQQDQEQ